MPEWISIGKVRSVNPNRREARIEPEPLRLREFEARQWLEFLLRERAQPVRCRVESMRNGPREVVVVMAPGVPRDTVAAMKGATAMIRAEEARPRTPGDWHPSELAGMAVLDEAELPLGIVVETYETRAHAVARIRLKDGGVCALPLVEEAVVRVDLNQARMIVRDLDRYAVPEAPSGELE